jgi:hypothetical protein
MVPSPVRVTPMRLGRTRHCRDGDRHNKRDLNKRNPRFSHDAPRPVLFSSLRCRRIIAAAIADSKTPDFGAANIYLLLVEKII